MPTKPSKALLQARSDLLDKEVERHEIEEKCASLEARVLELQELLAGAGNAQEQYRTTIADLEAATGVLAGRNAELENANTAVGEELQQRLAHIQQQQKQLSAADATVREANKGRAAAIADNNTLRDDLNRLTIENGRLAGSIEVYREFAPVPERDIYLDRIPRHERRAGNGGYASASEPMGFEYAGRDKRDGWYRRF